MNAFRHILKTRSLTNKMQLLVKSSILNVWLGSECASCICKIPFFSLLFCVHSFWVLTKISNLIFSEERNYKHRTAEFQTPIQIFRFKSKNSIFRKYVLSHMLRSNESTPLVIKNGEFTSVLILTVYSLLA